MEENNAKIRILSNDGTVIRFTPAEEPVLFGTTLREARNRQKLNQGEMAEILGVTRYTIMNWESNKSKPDYDLIPRICAILDLSLPELFGMVDSRTVFEHELIHMVHHMRPSTRRIAKDLLQSLLDRDLAARDEMLVNTNRIIPFMPDAAAAGTAASGIDFTELKPEPLFIHINDKTEKADAALRVSGRSMEPDYHNDDIVLFKYTSAANIGDDVVIAWGNKCFIKRLDEDGSLYSVNPDLPFVYEGDGSDIRILGKVTAILSPDEQPSKNDMDALNELFHDELVAFDKKYGID